jgi:predicted component of type VI protein secretion system
MPPQLVALTEGPSILLDKPILLIGRHQECDIQIPSRKISRRHCCIAQVNDHLVVRDLCSTNGIRINGVRVNEGNLNAGDELTIGNFKYEVRLNDKGEPVAEAPRGEARPGIRQDLAGHSPFESMDQPIALKDLSALIPEGIVPLAPGINPPPENAPISPRIPPLILPENLELAPSGDHPQPPQGQ